MDELTVYKNAYQAIIQVLEWSECSDDKTTHCGLDTIVGICSMTDRMLEEVTKKCDSI